MVVDGATGINDALFKTQIDDLHRSLDKNEILRSINIIDAMGNYKNVFAIDTLTALLDNPSGLIRDHAALALEKLKSASAAGTGNKTIIDQQVPVKENVLVSSGRTGNENAAVTVKDAVVSTGDDPVNIAPPGRPGTGPKKRSAVKIALAGIALVLIVILVISAGAFVYTILMPPVWSEQLQYKNSTGQYQSIIIYRNATDVSFGDVSGFVASVNATVKAAIAADTKERPVEYAAYLHDRAEERGINCSLVATGVLNGYPGQVLVAFHTIDNGMFYVDPTAKNVSAGDYPGIDYGKILFIRDTWARDAGFLDGNDNDVYIMVHRNAAPVSYSALMQFLSGDRTEDATYVDPTYTCANFATSLFNRSEAQGIKCGLVTVAFDGQPVGHAFNAFPTTDKGIVLIDDTGLSGIQKESSLSEFQTDAIVYLQMGKPLGELNLSQVDGHLDYSFYAEKMKMINEFYEKLDAYEYDVEIHNQAIDRYDADAAAYTAVLNEFNTKMSAHNDAIRQFNADNNVKYDQYLIDDDYEAYSSWYDANVGKIPPAPTNAAQLDAWKDRLDSDRVHLNAEKRSLDQRFDTIWDSEGREWAVYSYWQPPDGVVNKIEYVW